MVEEISKKEFELEVNGTKIMTPHQKLIVHDVLELAKKHGVLPGEPKDYILQGDKGRYKLDDWVDLEEDNVFITIPNAPTPVA